MDCKKCDAYCCRHVAVGIDTPANKKDFDQIRWYLLHKNVWVSIGYDDNWIVEFKTPCRHIAKDFRCDDYENRPKICADYPSRGSVCEKEGGLACKVLFKNAEDFEKYLNKTKKSRKRG
jgi:hypothetical protein